MNGIVREKVPNGITDKKKKSFQKSSLKFVRHSLAFDLISLKMYVFKVYLNLCKIVFYVCPCTRRFDIFSDLIKIQLFSTCSRF